MFLNTLSLKKEHEMYKMNLITYQILAIKGLCVLLAHMLVTISASWAHTRSVSVKP